MQVNEEECIVEFEVQYEVHFQTHGCLTDLRLTQNRLENHPGQAAYPIRGRTPSWLRMAPLVDLGLWHDLTVLCVASLECNCSPLRCRLHSGCRLGGSGHTDQSISESRESAAKLLRGYLEVFRAAPVTSGNAPMGWCWEGRIFALPSIGPCTVIACGKHSVALDHGHSSAGGQKMQDLPSSYSSDNDHTVVFPSFPSIEIGEPCRPWDSVF